MANSLASFTNNLTQKGVKQSYMYQIMFTGLPAGVAGDELNEQGDGSDGFNLWVMATKLPGVNLEKVEIKRNNIAFQLPNTVAPVQEWTTNVLLDMNMTIYRSLRKWVDYYSDLKKGGYGARGIPQTMGKVQLLDANGSPINSQRYVLKGIFPTSVPDIDLTHDNGDLIKIDVTWTFQYSYLDTDGDPFAA